jgi:hypothetical protein
VLQKLLKEKDTNLKASGIIQVSASGAQAAADINDIQSSETYIGYSRQHKYASPEKIKQDVPGMYTATERLDVNDWGLADRWDVGGERAMLLAASGRIVFRFHTRDLRLVLGPGKDGRLIRFRVLLDGRAPLDDCGADVDREGNRTVKEYRLY